MSGRFLRVIATVCTAICVLCCATGAASAATGTGSMTTGTGSTTTGAASAATGPPALTGHWTFDEGSGSMAANSVSGGEPLALQNGAGWGPGTVGPYALSLNGAGEQYAQTADPVIDTAHSFTVSAWVYLDNTNGYQTFVSQDGVPEADRTGSDISGFFLQLRADTHQFAFTLPNYESTAAGAVIATDAKVIPQPDEWYLLTGVYNAGARTASLYVNGTLAQTVKRVPRWAATGPLAVGRSLYHADTDFVSGRIDDVRTYRGALSGAQIAALAGPGQLAVDATQKGPQTNPTQFGEFLEDINYSTDGGLYAELIRNRDLKESSSQPTGYSVVGSSGATIALTESDPLTKANPVSLKLSVPAGASQGRAGVANSGWWGIPVRPSTTYHVSLYVRGSGPATSAPLTVDLESDSGRVWASATLPAPSGSWTKETATLTTASGIPSTLTNRFVVSARARAAAGGTDWFTFMSLFPPTYDDQANGFRIDLMQKLAALHPGYLRIPGGNYLEGDTIATRFDWQTTIGPLTRRPGHFNSAWGYWSQDGMGLLEFLELAQELHAQPVLAVWAGYTLDGTVVPQDQLAPYVKSAVDELQYANGPTTSYWGHQRALDGHPAPFNVQMVEIGNEDFFDTSGSYNAYRYPMFYDALHAADPSLKLIATEPVTSAPAYAVDDHYYNSDPAYFASNAHLFDSMSRSGPRIIVGEYATTNGSPTGTLADALGESAFLTGTVRNADLVLGASYAPLLVNVNAPSWPTNLIGYNALNSYGSPSYYAQQMLSDNLGRQVIGTQVTGGTGTLFQVATESPGHTYLTVVNDGSAPATTQVSLAGLGAGARGGTATELSGTPGEHNSLGDPERVAPHTSPLSGSLGTRFSYTFPANSLTVLDLATSSAGG
ncbi:MAG TPA: LamG-like jellyroll fold domain-containing protein [Solirubrobacteraceae bacterium]|nr:LamG-like jellyroll fold domain-containing protein [Solirubrobacteraceae bacterium]